MNKSYASNSCISVIQTGRHNYNHHRFESGHIYSDTGWVFSGTSIKNDGEPELVYTYKRTYVVEEVGVCVCGEGVSLKVTKEATLESRYPL